MPLNLQDLIHKFEEGEGVRIIRVGTVLLAILALLAVYDLRAFRNFTAPEAMDAAQLARNLAEGKGYTTQFIRPLSLYLVQQHRGKSDALLRAGHPDLANPPVYPLLLAGWMKLMPFHFLLPAEENYSRYQPEFLIALFNQFWFFLAVWLAFRLARRLFDAGVAWLTAAVLIGSDLYWRFSISGLPTLLLVCLFLGLAHCLVRLEQGTREPERKSGWFLGWAASAGVLIGLAGLTRYSMAALIVPTLAFVLIYLGQRRIVLAGVLVVAWAAVLSPWLIRNYQLSGTLFGTAGYAVYLDTPEYPGTALERSIQPNLTKLNLFSFENRLRKLLVNGKQLLQSEAPKIGGNWLAAFFLVGLLVPFRNPALSRLRIFLVLSIVTVGIMQAWGKTYLSTLTPEINTENLLAVVGPLVLLFGAGLFFLLLDQLELPFPQLRQWLIGGVGVVLCAPLVLALLPPRPTTIVYPDPPYYPWLDQQIGGFMQSNELMMSDMPWAMAWYGNRQCVWLTLNPQEDFYAINDYQKPVKALLITPLTLNSKFLSKLVQGEDKAWGQFILMVMSGKVPAGFPVRNLWTRILPEHIYLTDWDRWGTPKK